MAMLMEVSKWLTGINIILIFGLLYIYVKNVRKFRSLFTWGLIMFAFLFLVQNVVSFYFAVTMMPYYAEGIETYAFVYSLLQTFAFAILNYITWK